MCKKSTVAYGDFIGRRLVGWCVYNGKDYSFLSDKQVQARLQIKEPVNGLKLDADGKVAVDTEFTKSLMGKSGLAFSPIAPSEDADDELVMNKYYALVKVVRRKSGDEYHFITSRCGYEVYSESQLKAMLAVLSLGGVRLDFDGNLVIHKAVDVEDAREDQNKSKGGSKSSNKSEGVA